MRCSRRSSSGCWASSLASRSRASTVDAFGGERARLQAAFVFGSVAKHEDNAASDIDLMVLTDSLHYGELYQALQPAEAILRRPVSLHLSTPGDWVAKRAAGNAFVTKVSGQPKYFVLGTENALG